LQLTHEVGEAKAEFEDESVVTGELDGLDEVDRLLEDEIDLQLTHPDRIAAHKQIANAFFIRIIIPFCERRKTGLERLSSFLSYL